MKYLLVLLLSLVSAGWVSAQVQERWVARYNGTGLGFDYASAMTLDAAGTVYVTGWSCTSRVPKVDCLSSDFATVKYAQQ